MPNPVNILVGGLCAVVAVCCVIADDEKPLRGFALGITLAVVIGCASIVTQLAYDYVNIRQKDRDQERK